MSRARESAGEMAADKAGAAGDGDAFRGHVNLQSCSNGHWCLLLERPNDAALPAIWDIVNIERAGENRLRAGQRRTIQKGHSLDVDANRTRPPVTANAFDGDDRVRLRFVVKRVRKRSGKAPSLDAGQEWRAGWQTGRRFGQIRDQRDIRLGAGSLDFYFEPPRRFSNQCAARAVVIVVKQVPGGHHEAAVRVAAKNPQPATGPPTASHLRKDAV